MSVLSCKLVTFDPNTTGGLNMDICFNFGGNWSKSTQSGMLHTGKTLDLNCGTSLYCNYKIPNNFPIK